MCGHFDDSSGKYNGQTVKTKILMSALSERFPEEKIYTVDTFIAHKNPVKFFLQCIKAELFSKNVIILPAQSAVNVLVPFFSIMNRILRHQIHYYVVGGWLKEAISKKPSLVKHLKRYKGIYVELNSMKNDLEEIGLDNVFYVNKFRDTLFLKQEEVNCDVSLPHKLCFYSRVLKEKGIEDAVQAVKSVNQQLGNTVYTLDVYGPIDENYKERFESIQNDFGADISYKGIVDYHNATPILKDYFAMLFPTYYSGEGYANVVVDAFAAGLPVIATNWKYNAEVIKDGEDGVIYDREKPNALENVLLDICKDPEKIIAMKHNACKRAVEYIPQNAIKPLVSNLR